MLLILILLYSSDELRLDPLAALLKEAETGKGLAMILTFVEPLYTSILLALKRLAFRLALRSVLISMLKISMINMSSTSLVTSKSSTATLVQMHKTRVSLPCLRTLMTKLSTSCMPGHSKMLFVLGLLQ